jgi:hypothetical protein
MSHVASNIRVPGGKSIFGQRSLSNMQIARLALFEVNEKNARAPMPVRLGPGG